MKVAGKSKSAAFRAEGVTLSGFPIGMKTANG